MQFGIGAAVAPLVGVAGTHSAVPTATVIAALVLAAIVVLGISTWRDPEPPDAGGASGS